jgi:V/A-type H+-transporting ATPase subunit E
MAEELDAFLNRIHDQGISKAEQEAEEILAEARARAERTIKHAELDAEKIISQAENKAGRIVDHGTNTLKQAARDVLLGLRQQLQERMHMALKDITGKVMDAEKTAEILGDIIRKYVHSSGNPGTIEALIPPEQADTLEKSLKGALADNLQGEIAISPVPTLAHGFKLRVREDQITYDFSDEALAEALGTWLQPKLNALIRA